MASKTVTSHGSILISDEEIEIPQEGYANPLVISDPESGEIGLMVTPSGEVRLYSQDVITRWAKMTSELMGILNSPPGALDYISDSDPGDEA